MQNHNFGLGIYLLVILPNSDQSRIGLSQISFQTLNIRFRWPYEYVVEREHTWYTGDSFKA